MIQSLLYQINWPAILDLESVGTGPSSHPILLPFRGKSLCFHHVCSKFQKAICFSAHSFTMAFYSFGGVNDQCGATSWAAQETGMLPFLSCDSDMTAWLKGKQRSSGVSGKEEEDLLIPKLQVIQKISQGSYTRTNGLYRDLGDFSE